MATDVSSPPEYARTIRSMLVTLAAFDPRSSNWRRRSAVRLLIAAAAITRMVLSPLIVPTTSGSRARSIASASGCACAGLGPQDDELLDDVELAQELGDGALAGRRRRRPRTAASPAAGRL